MRIITIKIMNDVVPPYDVLVKFHWSLLTGPQTTDGFYRQEDNLQFQLSVLRVEIKLCADYQIS